MKTERIGGTKRTRRKRSVRAAVCSEMRISLRSLERAIFVLQFGVPELVAWVECGELRLGAAEVVARYGAEVQRDVIAQGAASARRWASTARAIEHERRARRCASTGARISQLEHR